MTEPGQDAAGLRGALEQGRGGAFRAVGDAQLVERLALDAGWSVARLDTAGLVDKADLMERIVDAFGLPPWFGRNWDALDDALRDLDAQPGTTVVWTGSDTLAPRLRETLWDVLDERAESAAGPPLLVVRTVAGTPGRNPDRGPL